jgi:hypothetical protein
MPWLEAKKSQYYITPALRWDEVGRWAFLPDLVELFKGIAS